MENLSQRLKIRRFIGRVFYDAPILKKWSESDPLGHKLKDYVGMFSLIFFKKFQLLRKISFLENEIILLFIALQQVKHQKKLIKYSFE